MRRKMPLFAALSLMLVMPGMVQVEAAEADTEQMTVAADQTDAAADQTGAGMNGQTGDQTDEASGGQSADQADAAAGTGAAADDSHVGELVFAQCDEYINVRSGANTDSEVTAKIYNNGSATVLAQEGDWFKIESGNAVGYVKAEYFATGAKAEQIAQAVAYNVASVHPEELNIRSGPDEAQDAIGVAHHSDELEVVDYSGDWMKVALGNDVYGYVNAYYVDYKTYYPTAETLEEEQARLAAEQAAAEGADTASADAQGAGGMTDQESDEASYEEPEYTETEPEYVETESQYTETEPEYTEQEYTESEYTETEPQYTEPEYTETEPQYTETEPQYTEPEYTETEPQYTETEPQYTETEPQYTEPEYTETEPQYTETEYIETEPEYTETEPQYTETEPQYTETEPEYTETEGSSTSGTGQQIADYAVQFVGNPYVWGGTSLTNGADCSGFAQSVFANFGIGLARVAADQACGGTSVSLDNLQAGDLVFYGSSGIDHVAIYIGGGQIVHAANSNSGIITSSCWYDTPVSARRYW